MELVHLFDIIFVDSHSVFIFIRWICLIVFGYKINEFELTHLRFCVSLIVLPDKDKGGHGCANENNLIVEHLINNK